MVGFEDNVKRLCREHNCTQKELYAAIGVTDAGMRKMFARNSCEITLLEKIADYFKVPVNYFFDGDVITASNNSLAIKGNGNNANSDHGQFLALLSKKDEQIDRLLSIIETISNK